MNRNRSKIRYITFVVAVVATVMIFVYSEQVLTSISRTMGVSALSENTAKSVPKHIFCYGDSLTAGTVPGTPVLHPYAAFLEKNMKILDSNVDVKVDWIGHPGWTASSMVEHQDLKRALKRSEGVNGYSLAVILAGTNDLGYAFQMQGDEDEAAEKITESVVALHKLAHEEGVPTLAIAIPDSKFQAHYPKAKSIARKLNKNIESWCTQHEDMTSFFDFPFGWKENDEKWGKDGLHFTEEGYFEIAKHLAPIIYMNT